MIMNRLFLFLFESWALEAFLCQQHNKFVKVARHKFHDTSIPLRLTLEGIAQMREQMDVERQQIGPLCPHDKWLKFADQWDSGVSDLCDRWKDSDQSSEFFTGSQGNMDWPSPEIKAFQFQLEVELVFLELHLTFKGRGKHSLLDLPQSTTFFVNTFFHPYLSFDMGLPYSRGLEFLTHLASLAHQSDQWTPCYSYNQLTTLDVIDIPYSPGLPSLLSKVLKTHTQIVAIICPPLDSVESQNMIQGQLLENRRKWWESNQFNNQFEYLVAFEAEDSNFRMTRPSEVVLEHYMKMGEGCWKPFAVPNFPDTVLILRGGLTECLILVHTPFSGQVTLSLDISPSQALFDCDGQEKKSEIQARVRLRANLEGEWMLLPQSTLIAPGSGKQKSHIIVDLEKGNFEVRIALFSPSNKTRDFELQGYIDAKFPSKPTSIRNHTTNDNKGDRQ
ncbi:hypothetical protein L218DRAFT_947256 [Marasmius fiardii PR-910]|nr:hypothetical protein L218DRAFT_947256 [Marasmius fiardii PR-910]